MRFLTVITGSTHTITPRQFIDDLKVLDLGGVGSKAIPNGLREGKGGQRPFQEYYDEKYFTQDAPPPRRQTPATLPVPRDERRPVRVSPSNSFSGSVNSLTPSTKEEKDKRKKKGLFRF
jgi:syntaxin-binding protein 1